MTLAQAKLQIGDRFTYKGGNGSYKAIRFFTQGCQLHGEPMEMVECERTKISGNVSKMKHAFQMDHDLHSLVVIEKAGKR